MALNKVTYSNADETIINDENLNEIQDEIIESLIVGDDAEPTERTRLLVKTSGDYVEVPTMEEFNSAVEDLTNLSTQINPKESAIADCDTTVENGFYAMTTDTINKPTGTTNGNLIVFRGRNGSTYVYTHQIACFGTDLYMRRRNDNDGRWSDWVQYATKDDLMGLKIHKYSFYLDNTSAINTYNTGITWNNFCSVQLSSHAWRQSLQPNNEGIKSWSLGTDGTLTVTKANAGYGGTNQVFAIIITD